VFAPKALFVMTLVFVFQRANALVSHLSIKNWFYIEFLKFKICNKFSYLKLPVNQTHTLKLVVRDVNLRVSWPNRKLIHHAMHRLMFVFPAVSVTAVMLKTWELVIALNLKIAVSNY
jgi:hypothetical protein